MSLHPGLKVGPIDWKNRLEKSGARYCEVWYNALEPDKYANLFQHLSQNQIHTGLHFWGAIDQIWEPNVAYPGSTLEKTLNLIKGTIDTAATHSFEYVNIHCGNRRLIKVNLIEQCFLPDKTSRELTLEEAESIQTQSLHELNTYAQSKHVLFLVETIPAKTPTVGFTNHPNARLEVTSQYSLPVTSVIRRAQQDGISITNDFCHTFGDEFDQPIDKLWQSLWNKTLALAPQTRLLHVNTVVPPYNGTDSHHGITAADFKLPGIFPTRQKFIELLGLFKSRNDVWAINEPSNHHVENYQSLVKLISEL